MEKRVVSLLEAVWRVTGTVGMRNVEQWRKGQVWLIRVVLFALAAASFLVVGL